MPKYGKDQQARPGLVAAGLLAALLLLAYLAVNYGLTRRLIRPADISEAKSVHFQYQDLDPQELRQLPVDLLVLDPDSQGISADDLEALKTGDNGQRRLVLAYLSVGQAEDYRDYWQVNWRPGAPEFIGQADAEWSGSYAVRFWDRRWRHVMEKEAARLAELGFDGAYLDNIDSYQAWADIDQAGEAEYEEDAADRMMDLVRAVRVSARRRNPEFLIVPQNAPELYAHRRWRGLVDGLGKEETWFMDGHRRQPERTVSDTKWLDKAQADGKLVLALDYPIGQDDICDFYRLCRAKGYACAAGNLALDRPKPGECRR